MRSINTFNKWIDSRELTKQLILEYKNQLVEKYKITSVNGILSALNAFFEFVGANNLKTKTIKKQKEIFSVKEKELTKDEYKRLLEVALQKGNQRLYYIMQTICSCGIRVSELKFITVDSVEKKYAEVRCKGKNRVVILSNELCALLRKYIRQNKITTGCVFITRNGKPMNRSNIWNQMKKLCSQANVSPEKVFPHNLRHLFARTYYSLQKDIVRLADILGHSSVNTTRIYTMESGEIHRQQIQKLDLVLKKE